MSNTGPHCWLVMVRFFILSLHFRVIPFTVYISFSSLVLISSGHVWLTKPMSLLIVYQPFPTALRQTEIPLP
jgi:hypothetical protein